MLFRSVLAQMSNPDMRIPIAYGLGYPARIDAGVAELDLAKIAKLNFESLVQDQFPCVRLAYDAMASGGTATAVLNGANEVAVEAFLREELPFRSIPKVIDFALKEIKAARVHKLDDVMRADRDARSVAQDWIRSYTGQRSKVSLAASL